MASIPKVRETPSTATRPFQHIYSDVKGKIATADFWGRRYFITFTCEVTRYTCVYFMRKKSEARSKFLSFLQWVRQQSDSDGKPSRVHQLRTDGGGEYTANEKTVILSEFSRLCKDGTENLQGREIRHTKTSAHTPQQNDISERLNRTLSNAARTGMAVTTLLFLSVTLSFPKTSPRIKSSTNRPPSSIWQESSGAGVGNMITWPKDFKRSPTVKSS